MHEEIIDADALDQLITVRDWLRFGVSTFTRHDLVYGHGTQSALDEAAYLILHTLQLPIDQLEPWLDARLTRTERGRICDIFVKRVTTRKPAPYLTCEAWIQGHRFYVDERVIVPRSFIGELMTDGLGDILGDPESIGSDLDLCTGSGCLAILAALQFPNAEIDAADISGDALGVAHRNVSDYGLSARINLIESDLFSALANRRYDLIICNPPYVTSEAVADFPPEYQAEPELAHAGGPDGLDLVHVIVRQAGKHLSGDGVLLMEIGMGQDALVEVYPDLPFLWLDTETSTGEVFALNAEDLKD